MALGRLVSNSQMFEAVPIFHRVEGYNLFPPSELLTFIDGLNIHLLGS